MVDEKYEKVGTGVYQNNKKETGLFMGRFPSKLANEWEKDCKDNYGGIRWMKAYSDHCKARQLETEDVFDELIEKQQQNKQVPEEQKEEKPISFGGGK